MALTEAQLYNLAVGDEVIVHGKCEDVYGNEDIRVNTYWTVSGEKREQSFLVHSSYVSLPPEKPKYDPCRLFRKGDIVRLTEWNGRCPALPEDWKFDNGLFKVHVDEKFSSAVAITRENSKDIYLAPICFLELVTPIEELEPYSIEEETAFAGDETYGIIHIYYNHNCGRDKVRTFYENGPESWDYTKAAAEAECDRLNADHRKKIS